MPSGYAVRHFGSTRAAVSDWVDHLCRGDAQGLWNVLDADLRLVIAQNHILASDGAPDDELAAGLAAVDSDGSRFDRMLAAAVQDWLGTHGELAHGVDFPAEPQTIGASLEAVTVHGRTPAPATEHLFITRSDSERGWLIAATGRELRSPGWPPGSWVVPALRSTGGAGTG